MSLARCVFPVFFAALMLGGCDDLDPNQSGVSQDHPGKPRALVVAQTRYRQLPPPEGSEEPPPPVLQTDVQVDLFYETDGARHYIELQEGDTLTASTPTREADLEGQSPREGIIIYPHTFDPPLAGETLTVALDRRTPPPSRDWYPQSDSPEPDFSDYYIDAGLQMDLPPKATITAPDSGAGFINSQGAQVTVTWSPFGVWTPANVTKPDDPGTVLDESEIDSAHTLFFTTTCDYTNDENGGWFEIEGDPGMFTVDLIEFFIDQSDPDGGLRLLPEFSEQGCVVDLAVVRHSSGTIDAAFADNSRIYGDLYSNRVSIYVCPASFGQCPNDEES